MDLLTFIAEISKAWAWPISILVLALFFRRGIAERIASVKEVSHKDTKVLFDTEAREVKAALVSIELPEPSKKLLAYEGSGTSENISEIVTAWNRLISIVRQRLASTNEVEPSGNDLMALQTALSKGLITREQYDSLSGLRVMRNLAVHSPSGEIDKARTDEFLVLADAMSTVLSITGPQP